MGLSLPQGSVIGACPARGAQAVLQRNFLGGGAGAAAAAVVVPARTLPLSAVRKQRQRGCAVWQGRRGPVLKLIRGGGGRGGAESDTGPCITITILLPSPLLIPVRPLTLHGRCVVLTHARTHGHTDAVSKARLPPFPGPGGPACFLSPLLCVGSVRLEQTLRQMTSSSIALRRASGEKQEKKERSGTGTPAAE